MKLGKQEIKGGGFGPVKPYNTDQTLRENNMSDLFLKTKQMIKIEDCDLSVRLKHFAKVVGAETIDELKAKLESNEPVYIPGSLIASRRAQYFNRSRILQELDAYQHHVLDRDPDDTL